MDGKAFFRPTSKKMTFFALWVFLTAVLYMVGFATKIGSMSFFNTLRTYALWVLMLPSAVLDLIFRNAQITITGPWAILFLFLFFPYAYIMSCLIAWLLERKKK
jgi:hypothetical protein